MAADGDPLLSDATAIDVRVLSRPIHCSCTSSVCLLPFPVTCLAVCTFSERRRRYLTFFTFTDLISLHIDALPQQPLPSFFSTLVPTMLTKYDCLHWSYSSISIFKHGGRFAKSMDFVNFDQDPRQPTSPVRLSKRC